MQDERVLSIIHVLVLSTETKKISWGGVSLMKILIFTKSTTSTKKILVIISPVETTLPLVQSLVPRDTRKNLEIGPPKLRK